MSTVLNFHEGYPCATMQQDTPDGILYVTVVENEKGEPVRIQIIIGKAGTAIMAWAQAVSDLCSALLEQGAGVNKLIELLSLQTSGSAPRNNDGVVIRSGVEGIVVALMNYRRMKFAEFRKTFEGFNDATLD